MGINRSRPLAFIICIIVPAACFNLKKNFLNFSNNLKIILSYINMKKNWLKGKPDFLGRCVAPTIVRSETNYGRPAKLEWIPIKKHRENAGELLACFELFLLDERSNNKYLPSFPPKVGAIYRVPSGIRPELQRTMIEVDKKKNSIFSGILTQ